MEIVAAIHTLGTVDLVHVYGHQNERESAEPLSWEATLNQHYDDIATKHLEAAVGSYLLVPFLPSSKVSLTVRGNTITHHIPTHLRTLGGPPPATGGITDPNNSVLTPFCLFYPCSALYVFFCDIATTLNYFLIK
jgi:hypothetical protein